MYIHILNPMHKAAVEFIFFHSVFLCSCCKKYIVQWVLPLLGYIDFCSLLVVIFCLK